MKAAGDKLDTVLTRVGIMADEPQGGKPPVALAQKLNLPLDPLGRAIVTVQSRGPALRRIPNAVFEAAGAVVAARARRSLRLLVPLDRILGLAGATPAGLFFSSQVRPDIDENEAAMATAAATYHLQGNGGAGVKVAVIDCQFDSIGDLAGEGKLSYVYGVSYSGLMSDGDGDHGTNCALVIQQMAPLASLYLYRIEDLTDLEDAVDHCIAQGMDVISHSMSWYGQSFNDGTGDASAIAARAISNGIIWVNSAGNRATQHWHGWWSDPDGDDWLNPLGTTSEFFPIYLTAGQALKARLTWDDFAVADQDYDIFLYQPGWTLVDLSVRDQPGSDPYESIHYTATRSGTHFLRVKRISASGAMRFQLFTNRDLGSAYQVASYSVTDPGSRPAVIAVGAMYWQYYDTPGAPVTSYSSQGPNTAGVTKPDIVAPTNVETELTIFTGTSCAAPNVAGALAIYLADPAKSAAARSNLLADAVDMGAAGLDPVFGRGRLELDPRDDPFEPNDAPATASLLTYGLTDGLVCQDNDYFLISVTDKGLLFLTLDFDDTYGDINVVVRRLNAAGNPAGPRHVANSTTDGEDLTIAVNAGIYQVKVFLAAGELNLYSIDLHGIFVISPP